MLNVVELGQTLRDAGGEVPALQIGGRPIGYGVHTSFIEDASRERESSRRSRFR